MDFTIFQVKYSGTENSVLSSSVSVCIKSRTNELILFTLSFSESLVSVPHVNIVPISSSRVKMARIS